MNRKIIFTLLFFITIFSSALAQEKIPYTIYTAKGKKTTYKKLLKQAENNEIILFGELHNDPICHWLQLELTKDLAKKHSLILGAEMFEADNQEALNKYVKGEINQKAFDTLARLWPNYKTDYKPIVDFAKSKNIDFVATNIPRRFASLVYKKGPDALLELSEIEKSWMAPLPMKYDGTLSQYVKMLDMMQGHGGENLPKSQASKDATMGYFINKNIKNNTIFIHYHGSYHSNYYEGIYWYLKQYNTNYKIMTIATVEQDDVTELEKENIGAADFIIVTNKNMTKTH